MRDRQASNRRRLATVVAAIAVVAGGLAQVQAQQPTQSLGQRDPSRLRPSPGQKPLWYARHVPPLVPGAPSPGPKLVVLDPRVGSLIPVNEILWGSKWQIYWRVQNQGAQATTSPATLRLRCEVVGLTGGPFDSDIRRCVCSDVDERTFTIQPLKPGASSGEFLTLLGYISRVPCGVGWHGRVTATVGPRRTPAEGGPTLGGTPQAAGDTLILDFCR